MAHDQIRLRHLKTFIEVARQKSVARASEALNVSQPAVTKTLRELEAALGEAVVERDGRGIRVTRTGNLFLKHAGAAMSALREGVDAVRLGGETSGQPIRVGALPTVSVRIMPQAVLAFLKDDARTPIKIVSGENAVMLEQLRAGELDLVVGRLADPEKMVGFYFEHLYSEQVVFVVRKGHPLLEAPQDIFARLAAYLLLVPTRESVIRPFVDRLFIANGMVLPARVIETVSDSFGRALLKQSDAVWIISTGVVAGDIANGELVALPIDTEDTRGPVGLTMRTDFAGTPAFDFLLERIREVVRPAGPGARAGRRS